ncbi:MerR family transcriptional regulator [Peribacillus saganii]|uniref:MerR family transcriptional regulator n=1 Tax=Peribacillus saganii TaxID=2303992 RepID=A0A372LDZ8_9BACI|nr:MerR family transcriptional regulator [Peribacillus saganii]RFU64500.1 MerR family transcriptional regulator [Peribacillus saganii]
MATNQILRAYSIKDVSKRINIPTGTIRQWEKDLQGLLHVPRSKQGARFYTQTEISLLEKVKEMRANNLSKEMIRKLLERHNTKVSEAVSETSETSMPAVAEKAVVTSEKPAASAMVPNTEELFAAMEMYRQHMLAEIKDAMQSNRNEIIEQVKKEISSGSMQTVQGLSKSIQRSSEKTKTEVRELAHTVAAASERTFETFEALSEDIAKASERTSETFEALSEDIAKVSERTSDTFEALSIDIVKASEATCDKITKRLNESSKITTRDYKNMMAKVSQDVKTAQKEINTVARVLNRDQEAFVDTMNQGLKELTQVIREREEAFHGMVTSFREAAAAKNEKKWWKPWS